MPGFLGRSAGCRDATCAGHAACVSDRAGVGNATGVGGAVRAGSAAGAGGVAGLRRPTRSNGAAASALPALSCVRMGRVDCLVEPCIGRYSRSVAAAFRADEVATAFAQTSGTATTWCRAAHAAERRLAAADHCAIWWGRCCAACRAGGAAGWRGPTCCARGGGATRTGAAVKTGDSAAAAGAARCPIEVRACIGGAFRKAR